MGSEDTSIDRETRKNLKSSKFTVTALTIGQKDHQYFENRYNAENYEDNLDNEFEDEDTVLDDPVVKLKNNILFVQIRVRSRDLTTPPGEDGYLVPILKIAKNISPKSSINYIKVYICDNEHDKIKSKFYSVEKIKQVNWKKVENMDDDDLNDFFDDFANQQY